MKNEQLKLTASFINTIANNLLMVGVLTPFAALTFRLNPILTFDSLWPLAVAFLGYAIVLHILARVVLTWMT